MENRIIIDKTNRKSKSRKVSSNVIFILVTLCKEWRHLYISVHNLKVLCNMQTMQQAKLLLTKCFFLQFTGRCSSGVRPIFVRATLRVPPFTTCLRIHRLRTCFNARLCGRYTRCHGRLGLERITYVCGGRRVAYYLRHFTQCGCR